MKSNLLIKSCAAFIRHKGNKTFLVAGKSPHWSRCLKGESGKETDGVRLIGGSDIQRSIDNTSFWACDYSFFHKENLALLSSWNEAKHILNACMLLSTPPPPNLPGHFITIKIITLRGCPQACIFKRHEEEGQFVSVQTREWDSLACTTSCG